MAKNDNVRYWYIRIGNEFWDLKEIKLLKKRSDINGFALICCFMEITISAGATNGIIIFDAQNFNNLAEQICTELNGYSLSIVDSTLKFFEKQGYIIPIADDMIKITVADALTFSKTGHNIRDALKAGTLIKLVSPSENMGNTQENTIGRNVALNEAESRPIVNSKELIDNNNNKVVTQKQIANYQKNRKKYSLCVWLNDDEYSHLLSIYTRNKEYLDEAIQILNNWKLQDEKEKFCHDARNLEGWVLDRMISRRGNKKIFTIPYSKKEFEKRVFLTEKEYEKLLQLYGNLEDLVCSITDLSLYKQTTGTEYNSDFHALETSYFNPQKKKTSKTVRKKKTPEEKFNAIAERMGI